MLAHVRTELRRQLVRRGSAFTLPLKTAAGLPTVPRVATASAVTVVMLATVVMLVSANLRVVRQSFNTQQLVHSCTQTLFILQPSPPSSSLSATNIVFSSFCCSMQKSWWR